MCKYWEYVERKEHWSVCSTAGNTQQRAQSAHSMHTGLLLCGRECVYMIFAPTEVVYKPHGKPCLGKQHRRRGKPRFAVQTKILISFKMLNMVVILWVDLKNVDFFSVHFPHLYVHNFHSQKWKKKLHLLTIQCGQGEHML